jgi:N6-adenosine-specific RNA methylase IME4
MYDLTIEETKPFHPAASLFPLMEGEEYRELCDDIFENGLIEAIWLHPDGSIIDGRNRYRACLETGTEPQFRVWDGKGSLVTFVVSLNLRRRHLTSSQRAVVALDVLPMLEAEAKKRQGVRNDIAQIVAESGQGEAREQAAVLFGTNRQYVSDAKQIQQKAPDLLGQVRSGALTIPQAKREMGKREKLDPPPFPDGRYRVWYADPPWPYNDSGVINDDNYGRAERHYPTMSIDDLREMGEEIGQRCPADAVLFMWATSPFLEAAFQVVQAWGFQYKTSFVWDKVRHNYGHYNSVRHEYLLICTRGSCTPDVPKLFDSVQVIERSDKHSEKPEEFREIIDTLYPTGPRIELFSRAAVEGWERWGNESAG